MSHTHDDWYQALKPWNKADDPCWLANIWIDIGATALCSNTALAQANVLLSLCWMFMLLYWMTIRCRFRSSKTLVVIKRFLFYTSLLLVNWLNAQTVVGCAFNKSGRWPWQMQKSTTLTHTMNSGHQYWSYKMLCPICIEGAMSKQGYANKTWWHTVQLHAAPTSWIEPHLTLLCRPDSFCMLLATPGVCTGSTSSGFSIFFLWILCTL